MAVERLPRRRRRRRHGVLVDSNGVEEPLLADVDERGITITHVLVTHSHPDHVVRVGELGRRFGVPVLGASWRRGRRRHGPLADGDAVQSGDLEIRALATPGHCPRPSRAAGERDRLLHRGLSLQGHGRRHDGRRCDRLRRSGALDHAGADGAAARDTPPPGPHVPTTIGDGVGAQPVHPHLARRRSGGRRAVHACGASRRR